MVSHSRFSKDLPSIPRPASPSTIKINQHRVGRSVPDDQLDSLLDSWKTKTYHCDPEATYTLADSAMPLKPSQALAPPLTAPLPTTKSNTKRSKAFAKKVIKSVYQHTFSSTKKPDLQRNNSSSTLSTASAGQRMVSLTGQNRRASKSSPDLSLMSTGSKKQPASRRPPVERTMSTASLGRRQAIGRTPNPKKRSVQQCRPLVLEEVGELYQQPIFFTVDEDWNPLEGDAICHFVPPPYEHLDMRCDDSASLFSRQSVQYPKTPVTPNSASILTMPVRRPRTQTMTPRQSMHAQLPPIQERQV